MARKRWAIADPEKARADRSKGGKARWAKERARQAKVHKAIATADRDAPEDTP